MNKIIIKCLIIVLACLSVLYPLAVRIGSTHWALNATLLPKLFPLFGLLAFTILWLHVVGKALESWLRKYVDFDYFVHNTSTLVLICVISHPLLLLINFSFSFSQIFSHYDLIYIWLAIIGWFLLITYDIGRALKRSHFFIRHWNQVLFISTVGFLLIFFHSLGLGSDLQSGPLRTIWLGYGVSGILATIYIYGVKSFLTHNARPRSG